MTALTKAQQKQVLRITNDFLNNNRTESIFTLTARFDKLAGSKESMMRIYQDVDAALWATRAQARDDVYRVIGELEAAGEEHGVELVDEVVSVENLLEGNPSMDRDSLGYFPALLAQLYSDAGQRAAEANLCINTILGRVVY